MVPREVAMETTLVKGSREVITGTGPFTAFASQVGHVRRPSSSSSCSSTISPNPIVLYPLLVFARIDDT